MISVTGLKKTDLDMKVPSCLNLYQWSCNSLMLLYVSMKFENSSILCVKVAKFSFHICVMAEEKQAWNLYKISMLTVSLLPFWGKVLVLKVSRCLKPSTGTDSTQYVVAYKDGVFKKNPLKMLDIPCFNLE